MTSVPPRAVTGFRHVLRLLRSRLLWDGVLALICALWAFVFSALFFPGRANVDIVDQYEQAVGEKPVSDWHPPLMSAVWHVLINLTGDRGSLLVLQVTLLALAAWLLGVLAHRLGGSRVLSLLGPAVLFTPWVLSQMTTLWKDTQMAVALALGVVLIAASRLGFLRSWAWTLWMPALLLLIYALGLRKNAVFALVPIAVYAGYCLVKHVVDSTPERNSTARGAEVDGRKGMGGRFTSAKGVVWARNHPRWSTTVAAVLVLAVLGGGTKAADLLIASRTEVQATSQISQIFLDDVMFSVPEKRLQAAEAPQELKDHISSAREKCLQRGENYDAYWNCYGRGESGKAFSPIAFQDELRHLWITEVITHPLSYLEYRTSVYSRYFFTSSLQYWHADWDGDASRAGFAASSSLADPIVAPYVGAFAQGPSPILFTPWFWTLLAVGLIVVTLRRRSTATMKTPITADTGRRRFRAEILMLSTSALCYVLGYFPIVPANHFRYTFWPAVALTFALVLCAAARTTGVRTETAPLGTPGEAPSRVSADERTRISRTP